MMFLFVKEILKLKDFSTEKKSVSCFGTGLWKKSHQRYSVIWRENFEEKWLNLNQTCFRLDFKKLVSGSFKCVTIHIFILKAEFFANWVGEKILNL